MDEILRAALNLAAQVDSSPVPAEDAGDGGADPDHAGGRQAALEHALEALAAGSPRAVEDGLIDFLGAHLLEALLNGNTVGLDVVSDDIYQAQDAVERASVASDEPAALELAETAGALRALSWLARLAAEQLVGPTLIDLDTHAGRMLAVIAANAGISNSALMSELELDKTQVSRAGRRLAEAGLAMSARSGKTNSWRITPKGDFTLAAAAGNEDTDTPLPLLAATVEALTGNGYEVVATEEAKVDDIQISESADGQTVVASRLTEAAKAAKAVRGAFSVGKEQLVEFISGFPEAVSVLRPTTGRQTQKFEIGTGITFRSDDPTARVVKITGQIERLERELDSLSGGKRITARYRRELPKSKYEHFKVKGGSVRKG